MKLGFLIGRDDDNVSKKNFKHIPKRYLIKNKLNVDVAIPYEIKRKYPDVKIDLIKSKNVTLKRLKKNDLNFTLGFNLVEISRISDKRENKIRKIFKNPKSKVIPEWKLQDFIYQKGDYLKYFGRMGIPITPLIVVKKEKNIKKIINQIKRKKWKDFIIKPYFSGDSIGFIKLNTKEVEENPRLLKDYFKEYGYFPGFVFQEALRGFSKFWEYRLFYLNGKFSYAIGNKAPVSTGHNEMIAKTVPKKKIAKLKRIGNKIMRIVPHIKLKGKKIPPAFIRMDFGCCLGNTLNKNKYFLNEIEDQSSNYFTRHTKYPVIEKYAEAYYKYADKLLKNGF